MSDAAAAALSAAGQAAANAGKHALALSHYTAALARHDAVGRGVEYAAVLNHIAWCHAALTPTDIAIALRFCDQAVAVCTTLDGSNLRVLGIHATSHQKRGILLANAGRTTEAVAAYELAIALAERAGDNILAASALCDLTQEMGETREYERGLRLIGRAETLVERADATPLTKLEILLRIAQFRGNLLHSLGRHLESRAQRKDALALEVGACGAHSLGAAQAMTALADSCGVLGELAEASALYESALRIHERLGHTNTAQHAHVLMKLGNLLNAVGDSSFALVYLERSLAISRRVNPPGHPSTGVILELISRTRARSGLGGAATAASVAASAAWARRSQPHCSGPSCSKKLRDDGTPLDVCVNCRATFYCGKDCQKAD